jgi:hypothetical protein
MNLHTYGIPLPWSFVQRGALLRQVMNENGDATKPLWNTEFGLDAGSIVAAWGMPKPAPDVGAAFDKHQKDMIADCLEFNRKAGLYQKCLAYQYAAGNEGMADQIRKAKPKFPPGMELDDYGFGFVRRDGVTLKPIFQHLIDAKVNDAARLAKPSTTKVKLAGQSVTTELNSDYPSAVAVPAAAGRSCSEVQNAIPSGAVVPAEWLQAWSSPPAADRPRQIVHAIGSAKALPEGVPQVINESGPDACTLARLSCYKERGLGGVVCDVDFQDYLRSEEHWKTLARAVESLAKLNMVVWIYDEKGYPSGAAGGLVLKQNPAYEATELAFDASRADPFIVRRAYEHTHASNNFFAARRYINLIDDRAVRCFIANTHEAYFQRLGPYFGTTVQATFTDEPSLITIDLGSLKRKVVDPIDPTVQSLPAVPWCYDLPQRFRDRCGRELLPLRRSLFAGNSPPDRQVRRQFWSLIADLVAERYFGAIQTWCAAHHIASSGHTLWEEQLLHHVPLEGNALKVLGRMDVPGLDMLTSDPEQVVRDGWMTAALPASAAALHGRRRVMTEISDFSQTYGGHAPATLPEMEATAAWQAAWGVTDFNLYYSPALHPVAKYRAYCDYVGRLNAVLKPAAMAPQVLLYYPIYDLWAEYLPVAEPLQLRSQSRRAQQIVNSFTRLGQLLQQSQIAFMLTDHESLSAAVIRGDGKLAINGRAFDAIILPDGVELPMEAASVVEQFRRRQGAILAGPWDDARMSSRFLVETLRPDCRISPPSPTIALGRFVRDGRTITLLANVGRQPYEGSLLLRQAGLRQLMDPADGLILPSEKPAADRVRLKLAPRQALMVVQRPSD